MHPQHKYTAPQNSDLIFIFERQGLKLTHDNKIPTAEYLELIDNEKLYCFASFQQKDCFLLNHRHTKAKNTKLNTVIARQQLKILGEELFKLMGFANHLDHWHKTHLYCGCCGTKNQNILTERAKQCSNCQHITYPRLSPCIIVLIKHGKKMLLARSPYFNKGVFSCLAGFIEPGETAEEAVKREVFEEVGVKVKNIQYQNSQPWPFPESLMLGFSADYESGEIKIDNVEIEAANWFDADNMPDAMPNKASIANALITEFLAMPQP